MSGSMADKTESHFRILQVASSPSAEVPIPRWCNVNVIVVVVLVAADTVASNQWNHLVTHGTAATRLKHES